MLRTGKTKRRALIDRAFTLIELTIVASLIVVLIAVSTPMFRKTFRSLELRDSAYNIGKVVRYAAASAIIEEKEYKIVFDFGKGAYWLLRESEKNSENKFEKARGRFGNKFYLPKEVSVSGDKDELIFLPNGRSTKAAISVTDKAKKKGFDINVTGRAGQVEIADIKEK